MPDKLVDVADYKPFDGFWSRRRTPMLQLPNCPSKAVSNQEARELVDRLLRGPVISSSGHLLWVLLMWCQTHSIPYELTAMPGTGYRIRRMSPDWAKEIVQPRGPADGC